MDQHHISEENLERYALGRISNEDEIAALEEHLLVCKHCLSRQELMDNYVQITRMAARAVVERPHRTNPMSYLPLAAAAAAAILFFVPRQMTSPVAVQLAAVRSEANITAPAGKPLAITVDLTGLARVALNWELASTALTGALGANEANLKLPALGKGQYWLRLRDAKSKELLREFSLAVR